MPSWKKVITSGSNAVLHNITSSGDFEISGNISGSSTSTGSFGSVHTAGRVGVGTTAPNSSIHVNASDQYSLIRFTNSGASTGGQFGFTNDDAYVWNNEGSGKVSDPFLSSPVVFEGSEVPRKLRETAGMNSDQVSSESDQT